MEPIKMTKNVLEIKKLNKIASDRGKQVLLKDVSFSIPRGSLTVLIGENGAGKSTTIKSVVGLYTYNSGEILINGISNKNIKTHYKISYIPEKENFPKISAQVFLREMARLSGVADKTFEEKTKYFSNMFEIDKKLDLRLDKMSSGQRKKIMLMQGFYNDADIYIMDEPTENLDPQNRKKFFDELDVLKKRGKSILISTHNLDEISKHADRAVVIDKGQIVFEGNLQQGHDLTELYYDFKMNGDKNVFKNMNSKQTAQKRYSRMFQQGLLTEAEYKLLSGKK
ncbi:MAG: ABC transporter ATP-binding protein [Mycoplasmataceae bacterium]|jgi:ABC-2 type transport system ATP-binding protein|nr:ABC transporter ATP-binding protein [Mycoplasmataceae bacterium]